MQFDVCLCDLSRNRLGRGNLSLYWSLFPSLPSLLPSFLPSLISSLSAIPLHLFFSLYLYLYLRFTTVSPLVFIPSFLLSSPLLSFLCLRFAFLSLLCLFPINLLLLIFTLFLYLLPYLFLLHSSSFFSYLIFFLILTSLSLSFRVTSLPFLPRLGPSTCSCIWTQYRFSCTFTSICTWSLKCYLYLYLDPKYLKNTNYIQVQISTLYLIKSYILYIDSSELCVATIG